MSGVRREVPPLGSMHQATNFFPGGFQCVSHRPPNTNLIEPSSCIFSKADWMLHCEALSSSARVSSVAGPFSLRRALIRSLRSSDSAFIGLRLSAQNVRIFANPIPCRRPSTEGPKTKKEAALPDAAGFERSGSKMLCSNKQCHFPTFLFDRVLTVFSASTHLTAGIRFAMTSPADVALCANGEKPRTSIASKIN
jgi:hypothetical protein